MEIGIMALGVDGQETQLVDIRMRHPREKCKRKMYRTLQHVHYIIGIITDIIIPMQKHFITPTHLVWVVPGMIGRQIIVCR